MFRLFSPNLAIDLGTANTLFYETGTGVVLNEPSMVALSYFEGKQEIVAIGAEAKQMLGRTPEGVDVIRPIRTGVIADFDVASKMIKYFLNSVRKKKASLVRPSHIIVGVPSGITEVEKRAIKDALEGEARDIKLIDEAMAAAIGCDLPVTEATASMIVDIGGGTTDIAVISLSDIVYSTSIRQGGDAMDEAITNDITRKHRIVIGESTAELIKMTIGSAHKTYDNQQVEVRGRDLSTGVPGTIIISGIEIREAIFEVVSNIIEAIKQVLENTPPELSGDILSHGISFAGGGSLIRGLDKKVTEILDIKANIAKDPLSMVVTGIGKCLEEPKLYKNVFL